MPSRSFRQQRDIHSTCRWERVVPRSLRRWNWINSIHGTGEGSYTTLWIMTKTMQSFWPLKLKAPFSSLDAGLSSASHLSQHSTALLWPFQQSSFSLSTTPLHPLHNSSLSPEQEMLSEAVHVRLALLYYSQGGVDSSLSFCCILLILQ